MDDHGLHLKEDFDCDSGDDFEPSETESCESDVEEDEDGKARKRQASSAMNEGIKAKKIKMNENESVQMTTPKVEVKTGPRHTTKCYVQGCKWQFLADCKGILLTLFRVPRQPAELRRKWLKVMWASTEEDDNPMVCELHFNECDFEDDTRCGLRKGTIPSLRLLPFDQSEDHNEAFFTGHEPSLTTPKGHFQFDHPYSLDPHEFGIFSFREPDVKTKYHELLVSRPLQRRKAIEDANKVIQSADIMSSYHKVMDTVEEIKEYDQVTGPCVVLKPIKGQNLPPIIIPGTKDEADLLLKDREVQALISKSASQSRPGKQLKAIVVRNPHEGCTMNLPQALASGVSIKVENTTEVDSSVRLTFEKAKADRSDFLETLKNFYEGQKVDDLAKMERPENVPPEIYQAALIEILKGKLSKIEEMKANLQDQVALYKDKVNVLKMEEMGLGSTSEAFAMVKLRTLKAKVQNLRVDKKELTLWKKKYIMRTGMRRRKRDKLEEKRKKRKEFIKAKIEEGQMIPEQMCLIYSRKLFPWEVIQQREAKVLAASRQKERKRQVGRPRRKGKKKIQNVAVEQEKAVNSILQQEEDMDYLINNI